MKKLVLLAGMLATLTLWSQTQCGVLYAAMEETKSIGTQAGETVRDMKVQIGTLSQKLQESFRLMAQRIEEEWRKFKEAFNKQEKRS